MKFNDVKKLVIYFERELISSLLEDPEDKAEVKQLKSDLKERVRDIRKAKNITELLWTLENLGYDDPKDHVLGLIID